MDYAALPNRDQTISYGIHYNSQKPFGGVYYYSAKAPIVKVSNENGKPKAEVEIKTISKEENEIIEQELIAIDLIDLKTIPKESYQEQTLTIEPYKITDPYLIRIQGKDVNFSEQGINRISLSKEDRDWLRKAQNYFVTAEENSIKIGSAESYTSMSLLEALWSTAIQTGIDPKRFIVQIYNESRFNPEVKGSAGERGIGQFLQSTCEFLGYDWEKMSGGLDSFAYQAKASAEYIKKVGEVAYNGQGPMAEAYKEKISTRLSTINDSNSTECVFKNIAYCDT